MATHETEFKVGITILIGLAILAGSLYWLEGYRIAGETQRIKVLFSDVGTLQIGDRVTVSGVRKGKVDDLKLTDSGVVVELALDQDVVLKADAAITIKNLGLMGERFIAINPGKDSTKLDASKTVPGLYDTGLPEVMGLMGEMITELRELVRTVKNTIGSDTGLAKFNTALDHLNHLTGSLADYVDRNKGKLDETAQNFLVASRHLDRILKDNSGKVDSTLERMDRVSTKLESFTYQLDSLAAAAREFADYVNTNDGTVQLLLEDRRLYDDLRRTADNIDDLVNDIRNDPQKYINLKVELF
jgi:phospholipid/cholesterol/gamma-HCH transport system substrate-binding protein